MVEPRQRFGADKWTTEGAGKRTGGFPVFCDAASALTDEECVGTLHELGITMSIKVVPQISHLSLE